MMRNTFRDLQVEKLTLDDVISYLRSTGWRRVKYDDDRLIVFARDVPGEDPDLVALPASESFTDYRARMMDAVWRLATVEQTTPAEVVQKIQTIDQDVVYLRLALPHTTAFPSLEVTARFLESWRNLVVYGACMERERRRYFEQPFRVGREQARHFQFAHTFQGSFGFTIESQVSNPQQQPLPHPLWSDHRHPPMPRRVLERITRGLLFTRRAEQAQNAEEISEHFADGFNANMCRAAVDMLEELQDVPVTYSVRWSLYVKPALDVERVEPITLRKETAYYLRQAGDYLERTSQADLGAETTLEGVITSLSTEDQGGRKVTLLAEGYGKVSFVLEPLAYAAACDAHRDGRSVRVSGRLVTRERGRRRGPLALLNPHDFQVLSDS